MTKKKWLIVICIFLVICGLGAASYLFYTGYFDVGGEGGDGFLDFEGSLIDEAHFTYYCTLGYDEAYRVSGVGGADFWSEKIEGKKADEWIKDYAAELCKRYLIINNLFDRSGLTLSEDDLADIEQTAYNEWWYFGRLTVYGPMGIDEEVYTDIITTEKKAEILAKSYEDELNVSEDSLKTYLSENYTSFVYISMYYYDEEGNSAKGEYETLCDQVEGGKSVAELASELQAEATKTDSKLITTSVDPESERVDVAVRLGGTGFPADFLNDMYNAPVGDVIYYDDENNFTYTISERTDILADGYFLDAYRDEILDVLLLEQFDTKISEESGDHEIGVNKRRINGFDIRSLYS